MLPPPVGIQVVPLRTNRNQGCLIPENAVDVHAVSFRAHACISGRCPGNAAVHEQDLRLQAVVEILPCLYRLMHACPAAAVPVHKSHSLKPCPAHHCRCYLTTVKVNPTFLHCVLTEFLLMCFMEN